MNDKKKSIIIELIELVQFGRYLYYNEAIIFKKISDKSTEQLNKDEKFLLFKSKFSTTKAAYHIQHLPAVPRVLGVTDIFFCSCDRVLIPHQGRHTGLPLQYWRVTDNVTPMESAKMQSIRFVG